jgi:SAM-dependent methyltransferase
VSPADPDFEARYRADPDPFGYRSSWYERRTYAITLAALPRERYRAVWEPGFSIGELTALLADRADVVDASDLSPTAVRAAGRRVRGRDGVQVTTSRLPSPPPGSTGRYDLVMLSEVLYYLPDADRDATLAAAERAVGLDGDLVVVHWRHLPNDAWLAGSAANAEVRNRPGWRVLARHEEDDFVLDVLERYARPPVE